MGRNIWQSDNPVPMIKAVRAIVHEHANVQQAYDLLKKLVKKPQKPLAISQKQNKKQKATKQKK